MESVLLFTEDDKEILEGYTLISKENLEQKEYDKYVKKYPKLETEELYLRKNLKEEEIDTLSSKMAKPLMILKNLEEGEMAEGLKQSILSNLPDNMQAQYQNASVLELLKVMTELNMSLVPTDTSVLNKKATNEREIEQILGQASASENPMGPIVEQATKQMEQIPESIIEQAAVATIKEEYQAIGINTDSYQNS